MTHRLDHRLRWLERGGGGPPCGTGPQLIMVAGGLPDGLLHATIPQTDHRLDADPDEPLNEFADRALDWAAALDAEFVIIGGL